MPNEWLPARYFTSHAPPAAITMMITMGMSTTTKLGRFCIHHHYTLELRDEKLRDGASRTRVRFDPFDCYQHTDHTHGWLSKIDLHAMARHGSRRRFGLSRVPAQPGC